MRTRGLLLSPGAVAAGLVLAACSTAPPASKKRPPPLVKIARPEVRDVDVTLAYTVEVKPIEQAELQSKVTGYVQSIAVDKGDRVRRGQVLASIRPSDLPEQANQAREQVGQAEAQFKLESENARRSRELFKRGLISKAELDGQEARLQVAQAARGASQAGLGVVSARLRETAIVAPFDGWVTRRYADPGTLVSPGPTAQALLQIMRIDTVRVFVNVLERDVPQLRRGLPVSITVDAMPGRAFAGTVTRYAPALDPATRTLEAEIVIPNPEEHGAGGVPAGIDRPLKPGMYGHAALRVATHKSSVVLPVEAVMAEDAARYAFVVEEIKPGQPRETGRARRVPVKIGFDGGSWLEVTEGLQGGEDVIVQGMDLISNGAPVTLLRVDPKPAPQAGSAKADPPPSSTGTGKL